MNEQHIANETLNELEAELDDRFLRVHRYALVSTRYLAGLEKNGEGRWCVFFSNLEDKLEISRRHAPKIRRWLKSGIKEA